MMRWDEGLPVVKTIYPTYLTFVQSLNNSSVFSMTTQSTLCHIIYTSTFHTALLRRATAYKSLKNYKDAVADLQKVLQLEPSNATAQAELEALQKELASAKSDPVTTNQQGGKGFRVPVQETRDTSGASRVGSAPSGMPRDASRPGQEPVPPKQGSASTSQVPVPPPSNPLLEEPPAPPLPPKVQKLKEEGNNFFKAGQYVDAELKYSAALSELEKGK